MRIIGLGIVGLSLKFNLILGGAYDESFALKTDSSIWSWGSNVSGQLGDGSVRKRSSPVSVVGNHSFINISGGYHCLGLKSNGQIWTWGQNDSGQLGQNNIIYRSSPVSVIGNHSFTSISVGGYHCLGLKPNGLWAWGRNAAGQLGNNTIIDKSSPISVVGNHSFTSIMAGEAYSLGLKSDGSVWAWGYNFNGQLGINSSGVTASRSSPVSVVGNHSFINISAKIATSLGLKSDGSVWAWGYNNKGQLGINTVADKSSPVSVLGNHSFIAISVGGSHSLGLKSDGSVWAWGQNSFAGQLGDNTIVDKSSPVSVVGNHSFISISAGGYHNLALKSNGQIWGWGNNSVYGGVGDNTNINRSSPVLVMGTS